jgi:hypothetical protein
MRIYSDSKKNYDRAQNWFIIKKKIQFLSPFQVTISREVFLLTQVEFSLSTKISQLKFFYI